MAQNLNKIIAPIDDDADSKAVYKAFVSTPKKINKDYSNNVFSNERHIVQENISLHKKLTLNCKIKIDGIQLLSYLENGKYPVVFFDPQYRSILDNQKYGNEGERQKERTKLPQMTDKTIKNFIKEIDRVLMQSGHLFLWVDKYILCNGIKEWLPGTNLEIVDLITWNKERMGMGYRSRRISEHLFILQKTPKKAKGVWTIHNIPDVWNEKIKRTHAHNKPIGLQTRLIEAVTNENDIVIDPASGSFSVFEACKQSNRNFLGGDIV